MYLNSMQTKEYVEATWSVLHKPPHTVLNMGSDRVDSKLQTKYKEAGKKEANSCLYSLLPHTMETQHAKEAAELLSEVTLSSTVM